MSASPIGLYSGGLLTHTNSPLVFTSVSGATPSGTGIGTGNSVAGSNTNNSGPSPSGGKPQNIRRGPGRPRKEFLQKKQTISRGGGNTGTDNRVVKRVRGGGSMRGIYGKRKATSWIGNMSQSQQIGQLPQTQQSQQHQPNSTTTENNFVMSNMMLPSPLNEDGSNSLTNSLDQDLVGNSNSNGNGGSSITINGTDKIMQPPEEPPYFPEKWPGKVCALCCLGERSQLGQGEMLRIEAKDSDAKLTSINNASLEMSQMVQGEDKSPRSLTAPQLSNRRQKGLNKCK